MAMKNIAIILFLATGSIALAKAQQNGGNQISSLLTNIPGSKIASGILASSSDGMSRYLAPNGPIQPAITAISGLPLRAGEMANNGITSISSGFNSGARRLSQAAGQNGQIRMPGLDTAASMMPESIAQMGNSLHGMIQTKNKFIMNQARRGIDAANRMGQSMSHGLQVRSSSPMDHMSQMMSQAHESMGKGAEQIKSQLQQSLQNTMGRMQGMQSIGSDIGQQMSGYGRTVSQGLQGASSSLRQTGEQLMNQVHQNHNKNMSGISGMLSSLHDSMGQRGQNMQKNLGGLAKHMSSTAQQLGSSLQSAVQAPLNMLQSLGSGMMSMKGGSSSNSGGGRY